MKPGTVNVARSIWYDPAFKDQPLTEREAFIWLVMEAAWKPHERRLEGANVTLERGQLLVSIRFMAEAWSWKKSTVQRFIGRLKKRDMIGTETGTGVTVITIRKYNEYQFDNKSDGTAKKSKAGQQRDSSGTAAGQKRKRVKREEGNEESLPSGEARARESDDLLSPPPSEPECNEPDDDATASASDHDPEAGEAAEPGGADAGGGGTARGRRAGGSGGGAADRKPAAKPPSRRRQFPEDWWPTDAGCTYAEQQGCPDLDANVAACVDFHRSRGNTFADLDAAWRTWCRNACKYGWAGSGGGQAAAYGGRGGGYSNAGDRARQATDRMRTAAAEIAAEWDERDRAGADPGGSGAVPVVDLAAYRDGGSGGW